jgi:putative endonuclease
MLNNESTRARGSRGEDLALEYLTNLGYELVARNWRSRAGELDLIMRDGDCLVVVEVKARRGEGAGRAEQAISRTQARRLLSAGEWFIQQHPHFADHFWRCDLVAITHRNHGPPLIDHYINSIVTG